MGDGGIIEDGVDGGLREELAERVGEPDAGVEIRRAGGPAGKKGLAKGVDEPFGEGGGDAKEGWGEPSKGGVEVKQSAERVVAEGVGGEGAACVVDTEEVA